jgi:hypothetical protein
VAVDEAARRQSLQGRRQVGDHHAGAHAGQPGERPQALGDDVRVRRELVVGEGFVVREAEHRQVGRKEAQLVLEACDGRRVARDHQQRAVEAPGGTRDFQRVSRSGEPAPEYAGATVTGQDGSL